MPNLVGEDDKWPETGKPGDEIKGLTLYFKDGDKYGHTIVKMEYLLVELHDRELSYSVVWTGKRYRLRVNKCSFEDYQAIRRYWLRQITSAERTKGKRPK